jgi:hypothetical protein
MHVKHQINMHPRKVNGAHVAAHDDCPPVSSTGSEKRAGKGGEIPDMHLKADSCSQVESCLERGGRSRPSSIALHLIKSFCTVGWSTHNSIVSVFFSPQGYD